MHYGPSTSSPCCLLVKIFVRGAQTGSEGKGQYCRYVRIDNAVYLNCKRFFPSQFDRIEQ